MLVVGFSDACVGVNKPALTNCANDIFFSAVNSGTDASCQCATVHVFITAKINVFFMNRANFSDGLMGQAAPPPPFSSEMSIQGPHTYAQRRRPQKD